MDLVEVLQKEDTKPMSEQEMFDAIGLEAVS